MELDITDFIAEESMMDYSASVAEIGQDAGRYTWQAARERAGDPPPPFKLPRGWQREVREYFAGFGAWTRAEIKKWSRAKCLAILIQEVASRVREADVTPAMSDSDWARVQRDSEEGRIGGILYRGDNGRTYIYIGD